MGYVEYSLKIIQNKEFEELLIYSVIMIVFQKDKDVKTKIKRMIDTN